MCPRAGVDAVADVTRSDAGRRFVEIAGGGESGQKWNEKCFCRPYPRVLDVIITSSFEYVKSFETRG